MLTEILTDEELLDLTEKTKPSAQARVLDYLGISYLKRPSGTLIVYRHDALNLPANNHTIKKTRELDLSTVL
jgi:hypothetical protein